MKLSTTLLALLATLLISCQTNQKEEAPEIQKTEAANFTTNDYVPLVALFAEVF